MINKKILFPAVILSLCIAPLYSQSLLGLQYPMGIPLRSETGPAAAMGGTGVALPGAYYGMTNPANLGVLNRAVFSALLSVDFLNINEGDNQSNMARLNPRLFMFAFPLGFLGTAGFSVGQTSDTDAKFFLSENLNLSGITEATDMALINEGGSIAWQAGWGYSIYKMVSIGLAYQRLYFNNNTSIYRKTEGPLSDTLLSQTKTEFSGNGFSGGLLGTIKNLTLGLKGQYYFQNNTDKEQFVQGTEVNSDLGTQIDSTNTTFEFKPAPTISFGASYQFTPEWLAAADIDATLWNRFYSQEKYSQKFDNAYSFSVGGQYIPAPNLLAPKYYEIMQYRAGFRYTQLPVPTASEFAFTLGTGLPLRDGGGLFDIFLEYGRRKDSRYNNYSEEFFRVYLGINAGRKWYQSAEDSY